MNRFEVILTAIYRHLKKKEMDRVVVDRDAVEFFRGPQAKSIERLEEVFPPTCEGSIKEVKLLSRGKAEAK